MTTPAHAAYLADRAIQQTVPVMENVRVAQDTYRLRFLCPDLARRVLPGQFLMMRLAGVYDPLLARPLALYDTRPSLSGAPEGVEVVYLAKGKFTMRLAGYQPGQCLDVWGPLGNGFEPLVAEHLIMVAGGIGQTPFLALAKERLGLQRYGHPPRQAPRCSRVSLCYGAPSAARLAGLDDFRRVGVQVLVATEDGSSGQAGLVTDVLRPLLSAEGSGRHVVCCGPQAMMKAVAEMAAQAGTSCEVSLETPMACGIGICFTCVAKVRDTSGGWDYRRTCVEGPVFDARRIYW